MTADGVTVAPYEAIEDYLQELPAGATVLIDPDKTSYRLAQSVAAGCDVKQQTSFAAHAEGDQERHRAWTASARPTYATASLW